MKIDPKENTIVCGDNLEWLNDIPDESVQTCLIDPPFFSNRQYEVIWGNGAEIRSFADRFSGGIAHYIEWMRPRVELIHKKLKSSGSIFLHCDGHASHRLRCMLDDVFGEDRFVNEIIWKRQASHNNGKQGAKHLGRLHDVIYFYSKSDTYLFNQPYAEYDEEYVKKAYRHVDKDGRRYRLDNLTGPGGASKGNAFYEVMGIQRYWRYTEEKMKQLIREGRVIQTAPGRVPAYKRYLDEMKGAPLQDVWTDIENLQSKSSERLGYPTQKPEALIKRIIECSTGPGDTVLDCFGGGGTTAKVAADLKRKFITGDVSPVAVKLMAQRLNFDCPDTPYEIKNLPRTVEEFKRMDGHTFAETVCDLMGWKVNEKKSSDGGIDGWDGNGNPIQVKNRSESSAGRPDMQRFLGALLREKKKRGVFVAWEFARTAKEYVAEIKREHGVEIILKPCSDVFGQLVIQHDKQKEIEKLFADRYPTIWKQRSFKFDEAA